MTTVVQLAGSAATVVPTATAVPATATAPTPGATRATVRRVVRRLTPATLAGVAGRPTRACAVSIVSPMPVSLSRFELEWKSLHGYCPFIREFDPHAQGCTVLTDADN